MPAALSVRVSAGCTGDGNGTLTVSLINFPDGDTITVNMVSGSGSHSAIFTPGNYGTQVIPGVPNDIYAVSVSSTTEPSGSVYINGSSTVSLDKEVSVYCDASGTGGGGECEISITGVTIAADSTTATINAIGTGTFEYRLNGGTYQSSNTFTVTPGNHYATVRLVGSATCLVNYAFTISAPETLSVTGPARDWLPAGLPIYYTFQSPDAEPEPLAIRIEVSTNGIDFTDGILAGVVILPADTNGQYLVNVAPYLEATFNPGTPAMAGTDYKLFRRYRLVVGKVSLYDGETGTPELTTPNAHALHATVLSPIIGNTITLSAEPYAYNSSNFNGIKTVVDIAASTVSNTIIPYTGTEVCPKYPVQLYWLNRAGGWQTWVWDGKHEYGQEIEDAVTWQDEFKRTHKASIPDVLETVNLYSGFIPLVAYDTVFSVLSAIRVFTREAGVWKEVNLETGGFQRHKMGQRRKTLDISFTYAEPLTVQHA